MNDLTLGGNRNEARAVLQSYINSRLLPSHIRTVDQAEVIVAIGKEIGLPPVASLRTIHLINGNPTVSPAMMIALANKRGLIEDMKFFKSDEKAVVTILKKGRATPHVETFTRDDAAKLGLITKDNYVKQLKTMLLWRCVSAAMRVMFPEVIFGLYTPEEMGGVIEIDPDDELSFKTVTEENSNKSAYLEQVAQIKNRLSLHCGGDSQKMDAQLMLLTEYKDKEHNGVAFIRLDELDGMIDTKPKWLGAILSKMDKEKIGLNVPKLDEGEDVGHEHKGEPIEIRE